MARTDWASRSAVSVDPYAVPMKNAIEWPSRTAAPAGSTSCRASPSLRFTSREWCMPIQ